jgi:hypothetical protein
MVTALLRLSILLLLVAVSGCGGGPGADRADDAAAVDTAIGVQPRSPAEIEQQAQPMTPEQAEELGVIDTTIQVTEEP